MNGAVTARHLDVIAAQLQLALAQVDAARHGLALAETPIAMTDTAPAQCRGIAQCAKEDAESVRELMGGDKVCIGCGQPV